MCSPNLETNRSISAAAVPVLLGRHFGEDLGARRIVRDEPFGEVGVDAAVLLLVADGQRQHFTFGEVVEIPHGGVLCRSCDSAHCYLSVAAGVSGGPLEARRGARRCLDSGVCRSAPLARSTSSRARSDHRRCAFRRSPAPCHPGRPALDGARAPARTRDLRPRPGAFPSLQAGGRGSGSLPRSIQPRRRQGRLVAAGRFGARRDQAGLARRAGRGHRRAARPRRERDGRVLGRDRARTDGRRPAEGQAQARGQPGLRRHRPDRAVERLVAGAARHGVVAGQVL